VPNIYFKFKAIPYQKKVNLNLVQIFIK
jgi:hypothetical protein